MQDLCPRTDLELQHIKPETCSETPRDNNKHQDISKPNSTGGYRKLLSRFKAGNRNVTKMIENIMLT